MSIRLSSILLLLALLLPLHAMASTEEAPDLSNLPYGMSMSHLEATSAIQQGKYMDTIIALNGIEDKPAWLLRGLAYYERKEFKDAARQLAAYAGSASYNPADDERELYIKTLKVLADAYYRSDQLSESQEVNRRLMSMTPDKSTLEGTISMYNKTHRELSGNENRLDESSDHFKVIYDGYEHGQVDRLVLSIIEDAYDEIGREFDHFPNNPITVVLDTRRSFFDVTRSPAWAGGVFMDGRIRIPVGGLESFDRSEARRILRHEYVHALIYSITPRCPRWLHEGLAEYITIGKTAAMSKPRLPLDVLDAAFSGNTRTVYTAYNQSMMSVNALINQYSVYDIVQYLEAMRDGASVRDAFEATFMFPYNDFIEKLGEPIR